MKPGTALAVNEQKTGPAGDGDILHHLSVKSNTCDPSSPSAIHAPAFPTANGQVRVGTISQKCVNNFPYLDSYFVKHYYNIKGKTVFCVTTIFNSCSLTVFNHTHGDEFYMAVSYCMQFCVLICSFILQKNLFILPFIRLLIQQAFIKVHIRFQALFQVPRI